MTVETATRPLIRTRRWLAQDLAGLVSSQIARAPIICRDDLHRVSPLLDVWDSWPLADSAGRPVSWHSGELWFALAAPANPDPEERHGHARIHTFFHSGGRFRHLGQTFAEGFTPGSREWSGTACLDGSRVSLYFTAAGLAGEPRQTFSQRLFVSHASLSTDPDTPFSVWSVPEELGQAGGPYMRADQSEGRAGEIKAFRDPCPWPDEDGANYLLFTASSSQAPGAHNGVIGLARASASRGGYMALPPLIDASGLNNELERPHIVRYASRLYLFWSTQAHVFAPGVVAPTGLYGATAASIEGPWDLLNGHGLVIANPESEPFQAYSWWVLPDLSVASFVDYWGINSPLATARPRGRTHFGGTFAPFLSLSLDGIRASLA